MKREKGKEKEAKRKRQRERTSCVGHAIVQGDEGPVSEVAQGVQVHGVVVRHGEKQEKKEGEVDQEVEGEKEENNTQ